MSNWESEMYRHTESMISPEMTPWEVLNLGNLSRPIFLAELKRMEEWVDWDDLEKSLLVLINGGASIRQIITMFNKSGRDIDRDFYEKLCDSEFSTYINGDVL